MNDCTEIDEEIASLKSIAYGISKLITPPYMKSLLPEFDNLLNRLFINQLDMLHIGIDSLERQKQELLNLNNI